MATPSPRKPVDQERNWLRHFLMALALIGFLSAAVLGYYIYQKTAPPTEGVVPVQVKTLSGDGRNVICSVNLITAPGKDKALEEKIPLLKAVISETLANTYTPPDQRPDYAQLTEDMRKAMNAKLPRSQQVKEVLIQELLFGM